MTQKLDASPLGWGLGSSGCRLRLVLVGLNLTTLPLDLLLDDELILVQCLLDLAVGHLSILHLQFQLYTFERRQQ